MLDMGFRPAVDRIVGLTPADRQTLFFSATLEGAIGKVAAAYTRRRRAATPRSASGDSKADIEHRFLHVDSQSAKLDHLVAQLARRRSGPHARLRPHQARRRPAGQAAAQPATVEAVAMHGDKSQSQRERALARFERGDVEPWSPPTSPPAGSTSPTSPT